MFDSKIYVGLSDRESHEQRHDTDYYKTVLKDICRNRHAAFSLQVIEGGFFHDDGSWVDENTLLITFIDTPKRVVREIAKEMCTLFHQESVMITSNPVLRINVHDDLELLEKEEMDSDIPDGVPGRVLENLMSGGAGSMLSGAPAKSGRITIEPLDIPFSVCKVADYSQIDIDRPFVFTGRTDEEKSLVCPTELVPDNTTHRDDGWRAFRIVGQLDFSLIGILAEISNVLARNRIGIFAVSTYNTDYILTKEENFGKAILALSDAGFMKI